MSETTKTEVPAGTVFTLTVPLDRDQKEKATFYLKDLDIDLYVGLQSLFEQKKTKEAIITMIGALRVGGDTVERISGNFIAMHAAQNALSELLRPLPAELKKN